MTRSNDYKLQRSRFRVETRGKNKLWYRENEEAMDDVVGIGWRTFTTESMCASGVEELSSRWERSQIYIVCELGLQGPRNILWLESFISLMWTLIGVVEGISWCLGTKAASGAAVFTKRKVRRTNTYKAIIPFLRGLKPQMLTNFSLLFNNCLLSCCGILQWERELMAAFRSGGQKSPLPSWGWTGVESKTLPSYAALDVGVGSGWEAIL